MTNKRPVNRDDLVRTLILLHALHSVAIDEERSPLWEQLFDAHQDRAEDLAGRYHDDLTGDAFAAAEFQHACLVVEGIVYHDGQVPAGPLTPVLKRCNAPGCQERTYGALCMSCELERGGVS